jgi:hypothetical protein
VLYIELSAQFLDLIQPRDVLEKGKKKLLIIENDSALRAKACRGKERLMLASKALIMRH